MLLNSINRTNSQKLYCQLLEILKEQIEKGNWRVGAQMPTENQLCTQYNVSKATVRLAVAELASLGYLKKIQGKGTFIRRKKSDQNISMLINLGENSTCLDRPHITRIIDSRLVKPDDTILQWLNLYDAEHCFFLSRMVLSEDAPIMIHDFYIAYSFMPKTVNTEEATDVSLYSFIENRCGIKIRRIKEILDVSLAEEDKAGLLEVSPGMPVLRTRQICYAPGDVPICFSETFYRTEKYPRVMEFERLRV